MTATMDRSPNRPTPAAQGHSLDPLMIAVAGGSRQALTDLYGRTSAKLYGICLRLLGDEAEAEEVLQDVFVTVWRKADRFNPAKASPITWLGVLARNKAVDRLRVRRAGMAQLDEADAVADDRPSAFDVLETKEEQARLAACLEELDEQHCAMIRAAFLDGMSYPQLAKSQGVPLGTMKSWIRRSLSRLRGCLQR